MGEASSSSKQKAVDEAFRRMFDYEWGTKFDIDEPRASPNDMEFIRIFGISRAARILGSRGTRKRQRVTPTAVKLHAVDYKSIPLPPATIVSQARAPARAGSPADTLKPVSSKAPVPSKIDDVLARLGGPEKTSTVKKTSSDWESFKETDKQLQDELEKQAQGKDAYLVKKDFLLRVDNRKFEIEKEGRERERAKRATQG